VSDPVRFSDVHRGQRSGESESARVSAARTILEQALKAADLEDVQQRLDVLEQAVKSQTERSQW
jgi:hypothetical protein